MMCHQMHHQELKNQTKFISSNARMILLSWRQTVSRQVTRTLDPPTVTSWTESSINFLCTASREEATYHIHPFWHMRFSSESPSKRQVDWFDKLSWPLTIKTVQVSYLGWWIYVVLTFLFAKRTELVCLRKNPWPHHRSLIGDPKQNYV